ncbi:MAG: M28 family peptidase, partial [Massilia sp.]
GLPAGASNTTLDLHLAAALVRQIKLRNVAALLRGSDPVLKNTYVILSAHYDHLGMRPDMAGDNIYNGANDDGSGTVSVIEVASALAGMKDRPKRSILFLNLFGEELGMLGSGYYGRHPLVPVASTVGDLNLEQVGRTDGSTGPMLRRAALTGFDFSTLPAAIAKAGKLTGVDIYKDSDVGDQYFAQSDNVALAALGVPAHTLSVLYEFPDYHKVGDHWQKIDYANMAAVTRTVALGLLMLANDTAVPSWSASEPGAAPYLKAYRALAPTPAHN